MSSTKAEIDFAPLVRLWQANSQFTQSKGKEEGFSALSWPEYTATQSHTRQQDSHGFGELCCQTYLNAT